MLAKYAVGYLATGIAFALIDSIWLRTMYTRLYQPELGPLLGSLKLGPAVVFYLLAYSCMSRWQTDRGPWQAAWAQFKAPTSGVDYVRPSGSGGDSLLITAGQMTRRSRAWWGNVVEQFEASDVLIPVARLERQWPGGPVRGTFTARRGPDNQFIGSFELTAPSEDKLPAMLAEAITNRSVMTSCPDTSITTMSSASLAEAARAATVAIATASAEAVTQITSMLVG